MKTLAQIRENLIGWVDDGIFYVNGGNTSLNEEKWLFKQGFRSKGDFMRWYAENAQELKLTMCGNEECGYCGRILSYLLR
jgi:hypothetical protein